MKPILTIAVFLMSNALFADEIESVMIFHSDNVVVHIDTDEIPGSEIRMFNLDAVSHSERRLTGIVKDKVDKRGIKGSVEAAYRDAFDEVLNSPQWKAIYAEIESSTNVLEQAIVYRVAKIPAIVFNNRYVVYGVASLKEAMRLFNAREAEHDV